jgi:AcrR family transcriptional regulator
MAAQARAAATRSAGQLMRSRLLDVASGLFKAHGFAGVAITAIAEASDAFPSQITYYFRTKEALFVEAACRDMLHVAARAEAAAARARTPGTYMRALVDTVMEADGLALFVEALVMSRQRTDLAPQVARTIERLHLDRARAFAGEVSRPRWRACSAPDMPARARSSGRSRSASRSGAGHGPRRRRVRREAALGAWPGALMPRARRGTGAFNGEPLLCSGA